MKKLIVFNHVTLDGYFVGVNGDFSWAHAGNDEAEFAAFVADNASGGGQLLFGRVTYQLMASYWPTALADQHNPKVAAENVGRGHLDQYAADEGRPCAGNSKTESGRWGRYGDSGKRANRGAVGACECH